MRVLIWLLLLGGLSSHPLYPDRYRSPTGLPSRYGVPKSYPSRTPSRYGDKPRRQSIIVNYLSNHGLKLERFLPSEAVKVNREIVEVIESPNVVVQAVEIKQKPVGVIQEQVEIVQTPVEVVQTPVNVVQTPVEVVQTAVEVVQTPVEVVQTPVEVVQTPVEIVQEVIETVQIPNEIIQDKVGIVQTPVDIVQDQVAVAQTPAEIVKLPVGIHVVEKSAAKVQVAEVPDIPLELQVIDGVKIQRLIPEVKSVPAVKEIAVIESQNPVTVVEEAVQNIKSSFASQTEIQTLKNEPVVNSVSEVQIVKDVPIIDSVSEIQILKDVPTVDPASEVQIVKDVPAVDSITQIEVVAIEEPMPSILKSNPVLPVTYPKTCKAGEVRNTDGRCARPVVRRNVFAFSVPQSLKPKPQPPPVPNPEIDYDVIFLKAADERPRELVVIPPPQQKTLVYVLRQNLDALEPEIIELPGQDTSGPEVFYVQYNEGENPELPGGMKLQSVLQQQEQVSPVITLEEPLVEEVVEVIEEALPVEFKEDQITVGVSETKSPPDITYVKPVAAKKFCCDEKWTTLEV